MELQRFGLALMVVVGFFAVLSLMLHLGQMDLAQAMTGALIAAFPMALKWYFDSSAGSARKTELLAKAQPIVNGKTDEKNIDELLVR